MGFVICTTPSTPSSYKIPINITSGLNGRKIFFYNKERGGKVSAKEACVVFDDRPGRYLGAIRIRYRDHKPWRIEQISLRRGDQLAGRWTGLTKTIRDLKYKRFSEYPFTGRNTARVKEDVYSAVNRVNIEEICKHLARKGVTKAPRYSERSQNTVDRVLCPSEVRLLKSRGQGYSRARVVETSFAPDIVAPTFL